MANRTILGMKADGNIGLRCSLSGVDALTGDSSLGGFSFDDEWTDIVKIALTGTASVVGGSQSPPGTSTTVSHGLGYVPFIEARLISGSTINDDTFALSSALGSNMYSGAPCHVTSSAMVFQPQASGVLSGGVVPYISYSVLYVVYAIPVPNPI